ncbi:MAG: alpha/beta hydrolase [Alphaproteobacteria bacterium]|nr:alpha/beta hydrolase [Alphaproteobacteria bacterium]
MSVDFVSVACRRLELRRIAGAAGRPVLLFLHEGLGSASLWRDFPDTVAAATACPAVVWSRYGYGQSDVLAEKRAVDYMHREALEALPALRAALGLDDVVLIGHSDGASIALIHAGAARWPVRGLVLEAPHVFVEDLTVASIAEIGRNYPTGGLGPRLGRHHADPDRTFHGWNDIWLEPAFRDWNIEAYLAAIRCPVLAIQGEADEYGTMAQLEAIARQVSGPVETLALPGVRHSPHRDAPGAVRDAIVRFVASLAQVQVGA